MTGGSGAWDVVVVGAGSAGCALAARLADAGRRVLVLEAGRDHPQPADFPGVLRDATRLGAVAPGHPATWTYPARLTAEIEQPVVRGRVVGGSSAVNGGYFVRATRADLDGWAAEGNELWSYDAVLPSFRRSESDRDLPGGPAHGATGPVPVTRVRSAHPVAEAVAGACAELGLPAEPDKNADGEPGYGPLPMNVAGGVRVNAAMAYLSPRRGSPGLVVRGGTPVSRVVVRAGRAVGVQTPEGTVTAGEVVLAAGAVATPHLLMLSGIGPAAQLRAAGVEVLVDAPGVGADVTDHPQVYLAWQPRHRLPVTADQLPFSGVLNTRSEGSTGCGDLEVLPWLTPFGQVFGGPPATGSEDLALGLALMQPDSRGRLTLLGADPLVPLRVEHHYLTADADRRRMREVVRLAAELLRTPSLAPLVAARTGLPDEVLADDRELDRWVRAHLTTAVHLAGSARMGPDGDPGAVVDQHLRVRGVTGLRVVDTSVMPRVPSRGPAATAVAIGERAAELMVAAEGT